MVDSAFDYKGTLIKPGYKSYMYAVTGTKDKAMVTVLVDESDKNDESRFKIRSISDAK